MKLTTTAGSLMMPAMPRVATCMTAATGTTAVMAMRAVMGTTTATVTVAVTAAVTATAAGSPATTTTMDSSSRPVDDVVASMARVVRARERSGIGSKASARLPVYLVVALMFLAVGSIVGNLMP